MRTRGRTRNVNPVAPWLLDAVAWSTAPVGIGSVPAVRRWCRACSALVGAYEAGLGFFRVLPNEIVAVPRPALSVVAGRLHCESGPAISWPSGERSWFWRGISVPRAAIETPGRLTVADIHDEPNLERRRILLELMGYDRYVLESGGEVLAEDLRGRLWRCNALPAESEPLVLVEVLNSTPEPDGSIRRYLLRVPPAMRSAHEAVAWTFGLEPGRYAPVVET